MNLPSGLMIGLSDAGPRQRRAAAWTAIVLCGVALAAMPLAREPLQPITPFLPAYIAAILVLDLVTALLFLIQFAQTRARSTALLAGAYAYTGLIIVPHILTFPGVFSPTGLLGAGVQTAVWLWVFWHGGFPLLLIAHACQSWRESGEPQSPPDAQKFAWLTAAGIVSAIFLLAYIAIAYSDSLPVIIRKDDYGALVRSGVGPAVFLLNLLALLLLWHVGRGRSISQLWLMIAALASFLDVTLTLAAGARYSLGWYAARVNSLLCASVVLGSLLVEVHRLYRRLARLAGQDALTGLLNRRGFDTRLNAELGRTQRQSAPLSLIMLDVDHFKAYNDFYGHPGGDECLRRIGAIFQGALHRPSDMVARYGGEEFIAILPDTNLAGALHVAEAIRLAVEAEVLPHAASPTAPHVTISLGVATVEASDRNEPKELLRAADDALYEAKRLGRNRVFPAA